MYELKGIIKRRKTSQYTQIHNKPLQEILDPVAIGVLAYCMSLPDTWTLRKSHLQDRYGRKTADRACKVLSEQGYWTGFEAYYFSKEKNKTLKDSFYMISDLPFAADELHDFIKDVKEAMEAQGDRLSRVKEIKDSHLKISEDFCNVLNVQYGDKIPKNREIRNVQNVQYGQYSTESTTNKKINKKEILKTNILEEEEKVSSIQLEKSVKEYLTNELKYDSTLLSDIAEQMAAFSITDFTKEEMADQHNFMVEKNEAKRIGDWAFYFVNGIAMKRKNPQDKVAAGDKKKRKGSVKKAIREEMVPAWLHKEEVPAKLQEEITAPTISEERKKAIWAQVEKLSAGD